MVWLLKVGLSSVESVVIFGNEWAFTCMACLRPLGKAALELHWVDKSGNVWIGLAGSPGMAGIACTGATSNICII